MKKVLLITLILVLALFVLGNFSFVKAETSKIDETSDFGVTKGFPCRIRNGYGEIEEVKNSRLVTLPKGSMILMCEGKVTPNTEVKGIIRFNFKNTGKRCGLGNVVTENWQSWVTPSGLAAIICYYNAK